MLFFSEPCHVRKRTRFPAEVTHGDLHVVERNKHVFENRGVVEKISELFLECDVVEAEERVHGVQSGISAYAV